MKFSPTLAQQGAILIGVPLVFELVFVGIFNGIRHESDKELDRIYRAEQIVSLTDEMVQDAFSAGEVVQRFGMNGRPKVWNRKFSDIIRETEADFEKLKQLVKGDPEEEELVSSANEIMQKVTITLAKATQVMHGQSGSVLEGIQILKETDQMKPLVSGMIDSLHRLLIAERKVADTLPDVQAAHRNRLDAALTTGLILNILLAAWLAMFFTRNTSQRLQILMDNTRRLARGEPLHQPLGGTDELSRLDRFFNDMAKSLIEARDKEREIIEMKEHFVAMVSHDLRTPLMSVSACLALLDAGALGNLSEEGKKTVHTADESINRLMDMVNDVLDAERLKSGKLVMQFAAVSVSNLVERTLQSVTGFAAGANVDLTSETDDCEFVGDSDRLVQVLVNLVSNAVKFAPPNSTVHVTAKRLDGCVEFRVSDSGRGIPKDMQEKIFERFEQLTANDGKRLRGSGLGLAICKAIVEQHQGSIGVESEPDKGSTFWFRIPTSGLVPSLTTSIPVIQEIHEPV